MYMRIAKQGLLALGLAAAAVVGPLGGSLGGSSPANAAEAVSVRLKWLPQAQFAGFYVAKAKGFYEAEGLDMTINPGGPNLNAEALVASGADTFGLGSGTEAVLYARAKGLPLVCIGMSQQKTPFAFVARAASGIKTIEDFKGRKVATWFTGPQYTLYSVLAAAKIDQSELTIMPQPVTMAPFIDGQFDVATVTFYNELNTLKAQGIDDLTVFTPDDYGVTTQQDSFLVSEKVLAEKPELVQGFLNATLKGWKYAFEHKDEALDIVMAASEGLERGHQALMLDEIERLMVAGRAAEEGLGALDMASIEKVQADLISFGALKEPVDLKAAFNETVWEKVPASDKKL
ncbi:ABC transporter substrate-binding protein (plasmid) [Tistrella bauzanensis]|uniref:Thiamine pyrimidine synthase n=1 Tax=Tistrella arctica TaxID=3133430 RepID=A0ABU9YPN2_9PROT